MKQKHACLLLYQAALQPVPYFALCAGSGKSTAVQLIERFYGE
jgi:hypothetical protein